MDLVGLCALHGVGPRGLHQSWAHEIESDSPALEDRAAVVENLQALLSLDELDVHVGAEAERPHLRCLRWCSCHRYCRT